MIVRSTNAKKRLTCTGSAKCWRADGQRSTVTNKANTAFAQVKLDAHRTGLCLGAFLILHCKPSE
jgi:hypothetical protein